MINQPFNKFLFIDCETAPIVQDFMELPDRLGDLWMQKYAGDESPSESFEKSAGFHAEFAKVVCVSVGSFFTGPPDQTQKFKVMSITGHEEDILKKLSGVFAKIKGNLAGHNIKNFDLPFLCKRYIINGMLVPDKIDNSNKKPWEVLDLDTMEYWKFGSFQNRSTSLDLLTAVLGIESPKGDMDGSKVGKAFYEGRIEEIAAYCNRDVVSVARAAQKLSGLVPVSDENILEQ